MENPIYIGLSRQSALQTQMDMIANNIANMNTPGYRAQNMIFDEYVSAGSGDGENISMVRTVGQYQNTEAGPVKVTGNPFDLTISGSGFFGVQTPDGIMYTRAGNFELNSLGELVTSAGYPVTGNGGGTITIPDDAGSVTISSDGTIASSKGSIGKIAVTEFENEQSLKPNGNNLYTTDEQGAASTDAKITQGALESSNVQAVQEMTRMVDILREYQMVYRAVQNEHDRQRTVIQRLTEQ